MIHFTGITSQDKNELFLGRLPNQAEWGLFEFSTDWLTRSKFNPFCPYLESRALEWMMDAGKGQD